MLLIIFSLVCWNNS